MNGVVTENLGTHPGFNDPIVPVEAGADVLMRNPAKWSATLKPNWSPGAITVPLPLRLWSSRCLILNGFANADVLDVELKPRKVVRFNEKFEANDGGKAWVQLYGSDYTATTLGPFKAVFTLAAVHPLEDSTSPSIPRFMWWRYYGTSLVNKEFKEKVWGIVPNRLAMVETAYSGKRKGVRLLEDGRAALTMVWNSARFPHIVEVPQHLAFKTVAPRHVDDGENDIEMDALALQRGDSNIPGFAFDPQDDEFNLDWQSDLGQSLKRIEFTPVTWQCLLNYGGVVKIYDEHGRATPPS
jgi:hypothetical protein